MFLPKSFQFVKVLSGNRQHMTNIGLAAVAWLDGVRPVGEGDTAAGEQVDDDLDFRVEAMDMPGLMVHGVDDEPYAFKPE